MQKWFEAFEIHLRFFFGRGWGGGGGGGGGGNLDFFGFL